MCVCIIVRMLCKFTKSFFFLYLWIKAWLSTPFKGDSCLLFNKFYYFSFFLLCSVFSPFNLLICFIFLALYYQMLRDFINIYELFLAFLDEGKYINTISIYSPAIPNRCKLEQLCLIMGDGICYQIFYKY